MAKLTALDQLDNTYIIYTSDNGFHLGQHGIDYEKFTPYETDVRVPFFIRGPTVPAGVKTDYQATMVDLPATVLTLAGTHEIITITIKGHEIIIMSTVFIYLYR